MNITKFRSASDYDYKIKRGMRYGEMPFDALANKFEETDIGDEEDKYTEFSRATLINWAADDATFEHEKPRGGVDRSKGYLNLIHGGHRGEADDPAHPELFLGFGGPEDADPRQANTDPDFKLVRGQSEARLRYVNFCDSEDPAMTTTGGTRSEERVIKDRVSVFKRIRDLLAVFSTSKDGRRNGLRRAEKKKSALSGVDLESQLKYYGDYIKEQGLNPQRRVTKLSNEIIRNSTWYQQNTTDHEFEIAQYSNTNISHKYSGDFARAQHNSTTGAKFADGEMASTYSALVLLMSNVAEARKKRQLHSDVIGPDAISDKSQHIKAQGAPKDLIRALYNSLATTNWTNEDLGIAYSSMTPQQQQHLLRLTIYNQVMTENELLSMFRIYKAVAPGDPVAAAGQFESDAKEIQQHKESFNSTGSNAVINSGISRVLGGAPASLISVTGGGVAVANYSNAAAKLTAVAPLASRNLVQYMGDSSKSLGFATNQQNYRITQASDVVVASEQFYDNKYVSRSGGKYGKKYMVGLSDREQSGASENFAPN